MSVRIATCSASVEALDGLRMLGAEVIYCPGDVASREKRLAILERIKAHFSQLNVRINNAGVAPKERNDILEAAKESFQHVLSTNLQGAYFLTQAAANCLRLGWVSSIFRSMKFGRASFKPM